MKLHLNRTLKFWVDVEYESRRIQSPQSKRELVAQILQNWEVSGDAMRFVDGRGRICWKCTPKFLERLQDAELEAKQEQEAQYL